MDTITWILAVFSFMFGAVFASFAGVLTYRLPKKQSISKPGSHCPACRKELSWYENLPIIAYLLQDGKCRNCKAPIGFFSFLLELSGGVFFLLTFLQFGAQQTLPELILMLALIFLFLVMAAIDYESHNIYDITLILFALLSVGLVLCRIFLRGGEIWTHLAGAAIGFGFFGSVRLIAKWILKREAMGSGDVYLAGIGGFLLGGFEILLAIIVATVSGGIIELLRIKYGKSSSEAEIAFAPYLLLGFATIALYGNAIMYFYWEVLL